MTQHIVIANPNSLSLTTQAIEDAVSGYSDFPVEFECITSVDGPPGIQTQIDADRAVAPLLELAKSHAMRAQAFVVACFSDPGIHSLRELLPCPVVGIGEAAMLTAMCYGQRIGVIAIAKSSIPRHYRYFTSLGILPRVAGERSLDMNVSELDDDSIVLKKLVETAIELRDQDGASVIVFGCAGMASYRKRVEQKTGLPVIEPTQAAIAMLMSRMV